MSFTASQRTCCMASSPTTEHTNMRNRKHVIYDLSSVLKRCFFAGKDTEFGWEVEFEEKKVWINGWQYGFEHFLNSVHATLRDLSAAPMDIIFVREGQQGTTIRRNILPQYKTRSPRPQEQMDQYNLLETKVQEFFTRLGSTFVHQEGLEADDTLAYLARNLKGERVVVGDDGDFLILASEPGIKVRYQSKEVDPSENALGPF